MFFKRPAFYIPLLKRRERKMIRVDINLLDKQIHDLGVSNINVESKDGLINLLASIYEELLHEDEITIVRHFE
jgi:hypothetical protein